MKKKICQVGDHEVEKLFHREIPGVRQSCCHLHKPRTAIKKKSLVEPCIKIIQEIDLAILKKKAKKEESLPDLLKRTVKVFNAGIRKRDSRYDGTFKCIACDLWKSVKVMDAGHFFPSTFSALKFNEDNVHGECVECNRMNPYHLNQYKPNLIKKIGLKRFKILESTRHDKVKWDRAALLEIIAKYK